MGTITGTELYAVKWRKRRAVPITIRGWSVSDPARLGPTSLLTPRSPRLGQQVLDRGFDLRIGAFTDVAVADGPLLVHQEEGGPGPNTVSFPDVLLVVLHDGVANAELFWGGPQLWYTTSPKRTPECAHQ